MGPPRRSGFYQIEGIERLIIRKQIDATFNSEVYGVPGGLCTLCSTWAKCEMTEQAQSLGWEKDSMSQGQNS